MPRLSCTQTRAELGLDDAQWKTLYEDHIIPCIKRQEVLANACMPGKRGIRISALQALPIVQQCITDAQEACTFLRGKDRDLLEKHFARGMQRWTQHRREMLAMRERRAAASAPQPIQTRLPEPPTQQLPIEVELDKPEDVGSPASFAASAQGQLGLNELQWTLVYEKHIVPCIKRNEVRMKAYAMGEDFLLVSALQANGIVQQHITQAQDTYKFLRDKERPLLEMHFICGMQHWHRTQKKMHQQSEKKSRAWRKRKTIAEDHQRLQLQWGLSGVRASTNESQTVPIATKRSRVMSFADSGVVVQEEKSDAYMSDGSAKNSLPMSKKPRRHHTLPTADAMMLEAEVADSPVLQPRQVLSDISPNVTGNTNQPPTQYQTPQAPQTHPTSDQPNGPSIPAPAAPSVVTPEVATALAGIVPAEILADLIRLPAYLQVLHDLASNGVPPRQWAQITQGFHAQQDTGAAQAQQQVQSKVPSASKAPVLARGKELVASASSKVSKTAVSVAYRHKRTASPLPTFIHPQRRRNFSDEEQAMYWPSSSVVSAKPVAKAKAVAIAEEADQSNEPSSSSPIIMSVIQKENNVPAMSVPIVISPPSPKATQGSKRAPTPKRKRHAVLTEVINLSSSPAQTPLSVRRKERSDSAFLEVPTQASERRHLPKRGTFFPTLGRAPTTAGSSVASVTFQVPQSIVAAQPVSCTIQGNVPSSQSSMSELRPQPTRETQVLNLFVISDAVPGSGAYVEVESLVDTRYPATGNLLPRLSWDRFLRSLPPDFCSSVSFMAVLVSCLGSSKRTSVWDCNSLSYAISDARHHKPSSMQIAVHTALQPAEADRGCAGTRKYR